MRGTSAKPLYTAAYTVQSTDSEVTAGNLKYDITNEASVTDVAGNAMVTKAPTVMPHIEVSTAAPTVTSVGSVGTTLTVTMSKNIYATTMPDAANFTIVRSGGNAPTVQSVAGIPSTTATADDLFTLTLSGAIVSGDTLSYTQSSTDAKIPRDAVGSKLAAFTGQAITALGVITVSDVSTDNYINDDEDESSVTISGTSTVIASGTTVTVTADGSGTDVTKTDTTESDGSWSVSLTSDEVKALDAATPDADGESITITASATGAVSGTKTVTYDPTSPTPTYKTYLLGGGTLGSNTYLGAGDTASVIIALDGTLSSTNPIVQFKNDTTNFGSAVTMSDADHIPHTNTETGNDTGSTTDPLDFGDFGGTDITREALGSGYVYKIEDAYDAVVVRAEGTVTSSTTFKARYATTKPTTVNMTTHGTELFSVNSAGNTFAGAAVARGIAADSYIWFYPSAQRTVSDRAIGIALLPFAEQTTAVASRFSGTVSLLSPTTHLFVLGSPGSSSGVVTQRIGSYAGNDAYKTTRAFDSLTVVGSATLSGGTGMMQMRTATTIPPSGSVNTHGTQVGTAGSATALRHTFTDIPANTYFWFAMTGQRNYYLNQSFSLAQRVSQDGR